MGHPLKRSAPRSCLAMKQAEPNTQGLAARSYYSVSKLYLFVGAALELAPIEVYRVQSE